MNNRIIQNIINSTRDTQNTIIALRNDVLVRLSGRGYNRGSVEREVGMLNYYETRIAELEKIIQDLEKSLRPAQMAFSRRKK